MFQRAHRPHHLERQLRNAIAEIGERQPLEHDISEAAISRRGAVLGDNQRIGGLLFAAVMDSIADAIEIERLAVRPDAQHLADFALAQPDREIGEIGIGRRADRTAAHAAFAAPGLACVDNFLELSRPDHLPSDAHAPVSARDRRALARRHDFEIGKAWPLHRTVAVEQRAVEQAAGNGARDAPGNRTDRPEYGLASRGARG